MTSILFTDHPVCQLMADTAMHDPKYRIQLQKSASNNEPVNATIEEHMTIIRYRLLMLSKNEKSIFLCARSPNAYINGGNNCAALSAGRASANSRRALTILAENGRLQKDPEPFPLLRLPLEIRQQIYGKVLKGTNREIVVKSYNIEDCLNRSIDTLYGNRASPHWKKNPFSTFDNTIPHIYGKDITTGLLLVSKSIYAETVSILYHSRTFDFGIEVFGIVPFLRKMTPLARRCVQNIHMELCQHHREARKNSHDWSDACAYMANHLQLKTLSINVDMKQCGRADHPINLAQLQWVKDLVQIQGLRSLSYHASPNGHGLDAVRSRRDVRAYDGLSEKSSPGPDDVVDGDLKGAQPDLGRLFKYLRGEMLEKLVTSGAGLEAGA